MRAILCNDTGGLAGLALASLPDPAPSPGQVRIAVAAAGVNFADSLMITGRYQEKPALPFVPGLEIAGRIDALGDGVAGLAIGQRVLATVDHGGFAELSLARAGDVVPLPDHLDAVTAAGFAIAYGTALGALDWRAGLRSGERLLVHGAAGGAGLAAVEVGQAMGAEVTATARGEEKLAVAREHGAAQALDSETPELAARLKELSAGKGFDVAFDPVGGAVFDASLRAIAWGGRIVLVGFASGKVPQVPANILLVKNAAALGFYWGSYRRHDPERLKAGFARLFEWHAAGRIRPHVSHVLPLERTAEAIGLLLDRRSTGKVVVSISN
ncbi:MAG TPA: NADPH:quinone oxidoreductase family protein [Geminicoccaceae bacterium]|nr:NADPH:quinone oxidoreductase family protein [Geminicoccus sp.]HMU52116.1 NADPH:quinone oxidoreductase family protein [Geminicoccaceae bacterium]